jgi:hypothetical protein
MICDTRVWVELATRSGAVNERLTVAVETPARLATSAMVIARFLFSPGRRESILFIVVSALEYRADGKFAILCRDDCESQYREEPSRDAIDCKESLTPRRILVIDCKSGCVAAYAPSYQAHIADTK